MEEMTIPLCERAEVREMRAANDARAAFARFLASLFLYELTDDQVEAFAAVEPAGDGSTIDEGLAVIREYLRHRHGGTRQELAVDYARVFLGATIVSWRRPTSRCSPAKNASSCRMLAMGP